jgi:hypothetical protein
MKIRYIFLYMTEEIIGTQDFEAGSASESQPAADEQNPAAPATATPRKPMTIMGGIVNLFAGGFMGEVGKKEEPTKPSNA